MSGNEVLLNFTSCIPIKPVDMVKIIGNQMELIRSGDKILYDVIGSIM